MSETTTVTVRGVDSTKWVEFQTGIVNLYGNLYGNIGQEVTNALKLWLQRHGAMKSIISIPPDRLSVSYKDVGGLKEQIRIVRESVEMPLKHPELFRWLSLIPPKGVLIHGPPGTGKNILARAAAAQARAWLYILSIQQMIYEINEEKLRAVFQKAKESAPSVILIPDLGTVTADRQKVPGAPPDKVLSWLITEMDALENFNRVVVIGIAQSPEELEPSLKKKFQMEIEVSFPDRQGRHDILEIQTKSMPLADDVDLEKLAALTDKYPGVLLWKICQEAATWALRRTLEHVKITDEEMTQEKLERIRVGMEDFLHALDSVKPEV